MKKFVLNIIFGLILFSANAEIKMEVGINEFFERVNPLIEKNQQYKKMELSFKFNERLLFSEFAG